MHAQLQHGVDPAAGFLLQLLQRIEVPRVDDQRLLADRIGADAQRQPDVGIVQVVRRADAEVVHARRLRAAAQLLEVPIEPLELGEEPDVERVAIEDADRVVRIDRGDEAVAGVGIAFRWRGATKPPTPVTAKLCICSQQAQRAGPEHGAGRASARRRAHAGGQSTSPLRRL